MRSRRGRSYLATGEFKGVETVDALNQQFDRQREGAAMRIIVRQMLKCRIPNFFFSKLFTE